MALVNMKEMLLKAREGKYAVGQFNINNVEWTAAILDKAQELNAPVILGVTSGASTYMGGWNTVVGLVRGLIIDHNITVPVALHVDHGASFEICKAAIDAGFTSVMIDASSCDFEENIRQTKEVVEYAHAHGVVVESELGAIAGVEDDVCVDDKYGHFTHPDDAVEFVKRTGIDSLAIAIGTAHGAYKFKPGQKPELRFDILDEIETKMPGFPLVLHGASSVPHASLEILNKYGGKMPEAIGIPEEMLRKAASKGICKINVGTDIRVAYVGALRKALCEFPEKFDCRTFITPAMEAVTALVEDKVTNVFGSAHHAE